jgi:tryptophanyl-tRNA synthetase
MQPSGQLHWGNFFGSMRPNLLAATQASESFFFIADLHALTTLQDPNRLRQTCHDAIRDYLAVGFDPERTVLFRQSQIPSHTELLWILSTVAPMGLLERAVSYKDKVEHGIAASVGLFSYPVLMAADILLYDINVVPVGKDQKQHVEMTRDIALKFNHVFGDTLIVPEPAILEPVAVVPGVDGQKMSKSYGNTIPLFGDEKAIHKAVMRIETDSKGQSDPKDPDSCVIYQLHRLFIDDTTALALADEYRDGIAYGEAKKRLLQTAMDFFAPMRKRRASLTDAYVSTVLADGAAQASQIAAGVMERVRRAVGLA